MARGFVTARVDTSGFRAKIRSKQAQIDSIPKQAFNYWVSITPKRSGRARQRTELRGNVIHAQYPYAERLDREAWSKQAPQGMTIPTIEFVKKLFKKLMRKR